MADALLTAAAFAVSYFSFALLALAQEQHWSGITRSLELPQPSAAALRRWRCFAGTGLALGCALCLLGNGPSFGVLLWVLLLGVCAMAVAFTLAWKPQWLRGVASCALRGRVQNSPTRRQENPADAGNFPHS